MSYINNVRSESNQAPVFKLINLVDIYKERLEFYGLLLDTKVHSTQLKDRLLAHIPDLEAYKEGHDILLAFQKDIGTALKRICQTDEDEKAITLAKAAEIFRKDMLNTITVFSGKFEPNCQED